MNNNIKLLIVDDDPQFLRIHDLLAKKSKLDESPLLFKDGREIINFIDKNRNQKNNYLILLDIFMPEIDGWEVLDFIESLGSFHTKKVILVSSSIEQSDKNKAIRYTSVIEYIEKPLLLDYLIRLKNTQIFSS